MDQAQNITPDQAQQIIYSYLRTNYALPDQISKLITAQSGHETNGWTSNVWLTDNNGFGYGYQGNGVYAYYPYGIQDSVDAVITWLDKHAPGYENFTDPDQYAQALKNANYYTDMETNYAGGIARWYNDNLQLVAGGSVAVLVGLVLAGWFLLKKRK
jgi:hypothetical protein